MSTAKKLNEYVLATLTNLKTKEVHEIDNDIFMVGRGKGDLIISNDIKVSGTHVQFCYKDGKMEVEDLAATNPVRINGKQIESNGKSTIKTGDRIRIGLAEFIFSLADDADHAVASPKKQSLSVIKPKPESAITQGNKEGKIQKFHSQEEDFSQYETAGFVPRFIAAMIDGLIYTIIINIGNMALIMVMTNKNLLFALLDLAIVLTCFNFYFYRPLKAKGQTFGKKTMKLRLVYQDNSTDFKLSTIVLREIIFKLMGNMFAFIFFPLYLFSKQNHAIWDKLTKTKVIKIK